MMISVAGSPRDREIGDLYENRGKGAYNHATLVIPLERFARGGARVRIFTLKNGARIGTKFSVYKYFGI